MDEHRPSSIRRSSPHPTPRPPAAERSITPPPRTPRHLRATPSAVAAPAAVTVGYFAALDGLRALAVFAVVAYHLGELSGGFGGVDVFFVISGFLITRLLLAERERSGRVALGAFWGRRFRRLLPALLVVLVAVAIGSKAWLPAWRLGEIRTDALATLAYVANWRFILSGQSYFTSGMVPSPLRHAWSLAIEEQFYVLWPLVVFALAAVRRVPARRLVAIVSIVGMVVSAGWMAVAAAQGRDLSRIYYGTDTRAFALFSGAWLATWWDPARRRAAAGVDGDVAARRWAVAGTVALVPLAGFLVFGATDDAAFYQGGFQLLSATAVVVVAGAATGVGALSAMLSVRPLVWLGRRSYGIYLWAWPVQVFAEEGFELSGLALDATVVALAVGLAALSHWLVEEPIRTGTRPAGFPARSATDRRVPRLALSASMVAVVVALIVGATAGAPPAPQYTVVSDAEALEAALAPPEGVDAATPTTTIPIDEGPPGPFSSATTRFVDPDEQVDPVGVHGRPLKVMVAGDSVGWSLGWKLTPDLTTSVDVTDRALIGCGLLPARAHFVVGSVGASPYPDNCTKAEIAEGNGLAWQPDVVLLWIGAWEVYDQELDGRTYEVGSDSFEDLFDERVQERIDHYRALAIPTVIPKLTCFRDNAARLGDERHDPDRIAWVNRRIRAAADRNQGWVRLIEPTDVLCDGDGEGRTQTPEGLGLREDGAHFTPESATWFWNTWLAGQLGAAFDVPDPTPSVTTTTTAPPVEVLAAQETCTTPPCRGSS